MFSINLKGHHIYMKNKIISLPKYHYTKYAVLFSHLASLLRELALIPRQDTINSINPKPRTNACEHVALILHNLKLLEYSQIDEASRALTHEKVFEIEGEYDTLMNPLLYNKKAFDEANWSEIFKTLEWFVDFQGPWYNYPDSEYFSAEWSDNRYRYMVVKFLSTFKNHFPTLVEPILERIEQNNPYLFNKLFVHDPTRDI